MISARFFQILNIFRKFVFYDLTKIYDVLLKLYNDKYIMIYENGVFTIWYCCNLNLSQMRLNEFILTNGQFYKLVKVHFL